MFSMKGKVLSTFLLERIEKGHSIEQRGRIGNAGDRDHVQCKSDQRLIKGNQS